MSDWAWATPFGIQTGATADGHANAFNAGHLNDALHLNVPPGNPLLVASDTSGVWIVDEDGGPAVPLSYNWDKAWGDPKLQCLAQGIFGPLDVYAAGASLWETDVTQPTPLHSWRQIPVVDPNKRPWNTGTINRAIAIGQRQILLLACDLGVFVANIPQPGNEYFFTKIDGLFGQRFSCVAEGPGASVVLGAWGNDGKKHFGIFLGKWLGGVLSFTRASLPDGLGPRMLRTEIAVFPGDSRQTMYALCTDSSLQTATTIKGVVQLDQFGNIEWDNAGLDPILSVLTSIDGGQTWKPVGSAINGKPDLLFPFSPPPAVNFAGLGQNGYNVCIGVSPFNPKFVAVGINNFLVSVDGGDTWSLFRQEDSIPHIHPDVHGLVFDPFDPSKLYVCNDGGLATTPDLGATWTSGANRQLPNLECYSLGVSPHDDGVIAFSLQDVGNVYTPLYIDATLWGGTDGGDGRLSLIVSSGQLIRTSNDEDQSAPDGTTVPVGRAAREAAWDPINRVFNVVQIFPTAPLSQGVIPVDGTTAGLVTGIIEPVEAPTFKNATGETLVALAGNNEDVLGLFMATDNQSHWHTIASVPHLPSLDSSGAELPYSVTAVGSLSGETIFAGTTRA